VQDGEGACVSYFEELSMSTLRRWTIALGLAITAFAFAMAVESIGWWRKGLWGLACVVTLFAALWLYRVHLRSKR